MIHTYYVILGVIFAPFLAQNFKTKVFTAQTNLFLKCLVFYKKNVYGKYLSFATLGSYVACLGAQVFQFL